MALKPISSRQFSITIGSEVFRFSKASKVTVSKGVESYNDGSTGRVRKHTNFSELSELQIGKPFDPADDVRLIALLKELLDTARPIPIAVQPVLADYQGGAIAGAKTILYTECVCSGYEMPEADREGSGMAMIMATFQPGESTYN